MAKLEYFINLDERGEFYSDVRVARTGRTIAEFRTDDAIEWAEDGDDIRDAEAVLAHLQYLGVLKKKDTITKGN